MKLANLYAMNSLHEQITAARERLRPHVLKTPLFKSVPLSQHIGGDVWLKLESEQYTGSFKARGALNKILNTSQADRQKGFITASTGNHPQGSARALSITGNQEKLTPFSRFIHLGN